jgi:hypothetical protein
MWELLQNLPEQVPEQTPEALLVAAIGAALYALAARVIGGRRARPQDVAKDAQKFFPVALELAKRFFSHKKPKPKIEQYSNEPVLGGHAEYMPSPNIPRVVAMANNKDSINQVAVVMNLVTSLISAAGDDDRSAEDTALLARQLELTVESMFGFVDFLTPDFYAWAASVVPDLIRKARK